MKQDEFSQNGSKLTRRENMNIGDKVWFKTVKITKKGYKSDWTVGRLEEILDEGFAVTKLPIKKTEYTVFASEIKGVE